MEINLSLISDECLTLSVPGLEGEDSAIIKESIIKEEIKNSNMNLRNSLNEENFDIKIEKNKKENTNNINKDIDYIIEIKAKEKIKKEIEKKINACMEKEEQLLIKQKELKKINEAIVIDDKKMEKKIFSLMEISKEEYEKLINKAVEQILNYDYFIKDSKQIQNYIIKYKESLIIAIFFKIIEKKSYKPLLYIAQKNIIFLNNENLFKKINNISVTSIKKITDEIYSKIMEKISNEEIFKTHKEEYDRGIKLYREICYLYPILSFFENMHDKAIYEISEDLNLDLPENIFDVISRMNSQIPNRSGLHITLDYFKEHTNLEKSYEISLRGILLMYKKYEILLPNFKRSSFLYN